jgi:hypothetical protein
MRTWMVVGLLGAIVPALPAAQSPPPIQGTIALEGTMTKFYRGVNALVVTTMDGVEHVYHFAKGLVVHGGKGSGPDALRPGTTVIVHYRIEGTEESVEEIDSVVGEGVKVIEGVLVRLDRSGKHLTLKLDNGKTETMPLTDRAAVEAGDNINDSGATRVTVYYSDESGHKVVHYLKKTP